jgi:Na+/H+ antiporter NhaD/arsenite permease-like protein
MRGRAQETKESIRKYRMKKIHLFAVILLVFLVAIGLNGLATHSHIAPVEPVMILPFVLLLLCIAVMPFTSSRWWEHNYPKVSFGLAAVSVIYYFFVLKNGPRMIHSGLEYFSFIALIGSLFVVSGGIHVKIKGRSTPLANTILLALGSVVANVLGTTGASMILIRPFIRFNKYRISGYHIVFFIFIVSNLGGMLTPVGDPPLFLGYLKGIPFFWVLTRIWPIWVLVVTAVLAIFFVIDHHNYQKLPDSLEQEIEEKGEEVAVSSHGNYIFLAIILGAVFLPRPIREIVMLCTAIVSCLTTHIDVHDKNEFNFAPIKEVAILFAGIFATMTPAMDWLELNASKLSITQPGQFYWGAGLLSSFLDNAPTYLNFLSAAAGLHGLNLDNGVHVKALLGLVPPGDVKGSVETGLCVLTATSWKYVLAISAGAVMFGAMTYIGNGPNFMVKSIAEQSRVRMPSFFGYMIKYSIPILLPIFAVIWYFFFY